MKTFWLSKQEAERLRHTLWMDWVSDDDPSVVQWRLLSKPAKRWFDRQFDRELDRFDRELGYKYLNASPRVLRQMFLERWRRNRYYPRAILNRIYRRARNFPVVLYSDNHQIWLQ